MSTPSLNTNVVVAQIVKPRPMWLAAFFGSVAVMGLGHILVGRTGRGLIWFGIVFALLVTTVLGMALGAVHQFAAYLLLACLAVWLGGLIDALYCARFPVPHRGGWRGRIVAVLCMAGIASFGFVAAPFAIKAWAVEAFVIPTNAMMPSIVGNTVWGKCHACREATPVIGPRDDGYPDDQWKEEEIAGICVHCGALMDKRAFPGEDDPPRRTKDRVLANKIITPKRWDMIIFRYPKEPNVNFVMRLVGLPGERLELRNGEVTINGQIVPKPPHLKFLHYVDAQSIEPRGTWTKPGWGDSGNPVTLGPDEYYVLGDFSQRSLDSRLWDSGAPGHPPYAVPHDHITAVVTNIYWPRERWRAFERAEDE